MEQLKVLGVVPGFKIVQMNMGDQQIPALVPVFTDEDSKKVYEFPLVGEDVDAFIEMMTQAREKMPPTNPDLLVPKGPISEEQLARAAEAARTGLPSKP